MKMSATMFIPRNIQMRETRYIIASITGDIVEMPGKSAQLGKNKIQVTNLVRGAILDEMGIGAFELADLPVAELF